MAAVKTINIGAYLQKNILFPHQKFIMLSLRHMSLYRNAMAENFAKLKSSKVLSHCPSCLVARQYQAMKGSRYSTKSVYDNQPPSWLFINDNKTAGEYMAHVNLDLDLESRLSEERLDDLQQNLRARNMTFDVDTLVQDFKAMNDAERTANDLLAMKETLLLQKKHITLQEKTPDELELSKQELKKVQQRIKAAKKHFKEVEEAVHLSALKLPNDLHQNTPLDGTPQFLKQKHGIREPQEVNHVEAGEIHNLIKFSNVGPKAYYLKGELAVAEWTISDLVSTYMHKSGFRQIMGPEFFRSPIMESCGRDIFNKDEVLTLQHTLKDIVEPMNHLAGISPMTFAAYMARLCVANSSLPYNMFSCGKTYQKSDLPGLFGATQTTQVGLCSFVQQSDVDKQFDKTIELVWNLLVRLGFSTRLTLLPASDLNREERRRVEVQVFAPSLDTYLPVGHVSDLGDFVSRRLMTCHSDLANNHRGAPRLHMISGTVVNITSLLAIWVEHTDLTVLEFRI